MVRYFGTKTPKCKFGQQAPLMLDARVSSLDDVRLVPSVFLLGRHLRTEVKKLQDGWRRLALNVRHTRGCLEKIQCFYKTCGTINHVD